MLLESLILRRIDGARAFRCRLVCIRWMDHSGVAWDGQACWASHRANKDILGSSTVLLQDAVNTLGLLPSPLLYFMYIEPTFLTATSLLHCCLAWAAGQHHEVHTPEYLSM